MLRKVVLIALISIVGAMVPVTSALAIDLPDNMTVITAKAYQDLTEDDDMFVVFHAKINYDSDNGTYPDVPASSSIVFNFIAANGTRLSSSVPYVFSPFETNGYGNLVSGFYFSADDAPAWEGSHQIEIIGLPAHFSPVPTPFYKQLITQDYEQSDDQGGALAIEILRLCDVFKIIYPDIALKSTTGTGTVLSAYGEAYFKSALPGLENICPLIFNVQIYTPEQIEVTAYDTSLADTMAGHTEGSDLERGMTRIGDKIGVSGAFIWGIVTFIVAIVLCIITYRKGWGIEPGAGVSLAVVILVAVLIGDFMFNLMMIISLIAAIGIMYMINLRRA